MKLATFTYDGRQRIGAVQGDEIVDLQRAYARYLREVKHDGAAEKVAAALIPNDMRRFLERYTHSWEAARQALAHAEEAPRQEEPWQARTRYRLDEVRLERPIVPQTLMAAGPRPLEVNDRLKRHTEFYIKPPTSVVGPQEPVYAQPDITERMRPEAELGLVFVGGGRHVSPEQAADHIFGYTIFLDLIAPERLVFGWEGTTMFHTRYGEGASFDSSGVLGPWIVTRDEVEDLDSVTVRLAINGELQREYRLGDLWRSPAQYASYLSTFFPLQPAIVATCGVPYGATVGPTDTGDPEVAEGDAVGPVKAGDRISVEVSGIGRIETEVREAQAIGVAQ